MKSHPRLASAEATEALRLSPSAWSWLVAIAALALALRLLNLDWDGGHAFHPDERAMAFAVERVALSEGRIDPDFFAYGTLPIYLVSLARDLAGAVLVHPPDYGEILLLGRFLSALAGVASVVALFLFGLRKAGLATAVLAAGLLAVAPIHLQNSRFFTVDAQLTLWTLLALQQMSQLAVGGARRHAVLAGLFLGLACGTKLSGASLFVPLLVAVWISGARHRGNGSHARALPTVKSLASAMLTAGVSFVLVEPMVLVRSAMVLASLEEQAGIVRHAGSVPYTLQYLGTSPLVYPAEQLLFWGLGPFLGVALLLCALWLGVRRERLGATGLVLVSWVVPYLLFFAVLEVKYPRYLLPAVPILILGAAWLLARFARRHPVAKAVVALVCIATALQGFAFANLFSRPHPAVGASEWFFAHASDHGSLLVPDWDEGFPLHPGRGPEDKSFETFNAAFYDQPDDAAKLERLAMLLEKAEFVVFPTRRIYGSVFRARERFPVTSGMLANLFAGNLGFELVAAFDSRPRLFGFEVRDELADESVTVYDHPRVLIFRKSKALPAREIFDRSLGLPSPSWSLADFLSAAPETPPAPSPGRPWARILLLLAATEALGLVAFALVGARWRRPGAFAAARILGLFGLAYLVWLATVLGAARFDSRSCWGLLCGLVVLAAWSWTRSGRPRPDLRELIGSWACFYLIVLLVLAVRAYHPAIFWGEKPMDFGILNQLLRSERLPPLDPWFAGSRLNYSYFGLFVVAVLGKLSGLEAGYLFNVALAVFAGLAAVAALAAGLLLTRRIRSGIYALALILLLGNLAGVPTWLKLHRIDFDFFWATSRVVADTINEYPLWSLLFADLHAHLLALPLVILFCGLAALELRAAGTFVPALGPRVGRGVLLGWMLGLVAATSSWSALSMSALLTVATVAASWRRRKQSFSQGLTTGGFLRAVLGLGVAAATAGISFAPYWIRFRSPERNFGLHRGPVASAGEIAMIFGLSLAVLAPLLLAPLRSWVRSRGPGSRRLAQLGGGLAVLGLCGAVGFGMPARFALLALTGLAFVACLASRGRLWAAALTLSATGLALVTAAEFFFLWDRMNTVFKYYFDAWVLLGLAAAVVLPRLASRRSGTRAMGGTRIWQLWRAAVATALVLALTTSITAALGALRESRVTGPNWTLDGVAFLRSSNPDESAALRWLNAAVPLSPVLLEAYGPAYGPYGRVSMNSGLPTPLGWDYHVFQRAHPWSELEERKRQIVAVYATADKGMACEVLRSLGIELVYFGSLERATYGPVSEARLAQWPELLLPVFRNATVTIFRVVPRAGACSNEGRGDSAPVVVATQKPDYELREPRGIVAAADGYWVSDFGNHRVVKFDLDRRPLSALGRRGARPGEFEQPCGVAITREGRLLVADTWNHRLQLFDGDGKVQAVFESGFFGPRGVAIDRETGDVLVADTGNHRLVRLSASGETLAEIGRQGTGPGEFWEPSGVAVSSDHRIAVADTSNGRVQLFDGEGRWLATWPVSGWRREAYSEPNLVFSTAGDLWLTVPLAGEIRALDRGGRLVARQSVPAALDAEPARPIGIAFAPGERSLVVTTLDGRLVELPARLAADGSSAVARSDSR